MISKPDLAVYEFQHICHYFDYIVESEVNGQRSQVIELIADMSKAQKKHCLQYFEDQEGEDVEKCSKMIIESL